MRVQHLEVGFVLDFCIHQENELGLGWMTVNSSERRWVAIGCRSAAPWALESGSTGFLNTNSQQVRVAIQNGSGTVTELQADFCNWWFKPGVGPIAGEDPLVVRAAWEQIGDDKRSQLLFLEKGFCELRPGETIRSDASTVVVGPFETVYLRLHITALSTREGSSWPRALIPMSKNGEYARIGLNLTDRPGAGGANMAGAASHLAFGPLAVYGLTEHNTMASLGLIGDSLIMGSGDEPDGDGNGNTGPYQRAAAARCFGMIKMTRGGLLARDMIGDALKSYAPPLSRCGKAIVQLGTNDLMNGIEVAAIKTYLLEIWQAVATLTGKPVAIGTIPPRTRSTDAWATADQQSYRGQIFSNNQNSAMCRLNAWLRRAPLDHPTLVDYVIDGSDAVSTATDSGIWKNGYTSDGTHWDTQLGIAAVGERVTRMLDRFQTSKFVR